MQEITSHDIEVKHIPGKLNIFSNVLSRLPGPVPENKNEDFIREGPAYTSLSRAQDARAQK